MVLNIKKLFTINHHSTKITKFREFYKKLFEFYFGTTRKQAQLTPSRMPYKLA